MKKQIRTAAKVLLTSIFITLSVCSCASAPDTVPVHSSGLFFDTYTEITLYEYKGSSDAIFEMCNGIMERYDKLLDPSDKESDIWKINHSEGASIQVEPETADVIEEALSYCKMSYGALDITVGRLCDLWDIQSNIGKNDPHIPGEDEISKVLRSVDFRNVSVERKDDGRCFVTLLSPECSITLGAIAKGYVADRLYESLTSCGVTSALIDLGGNIRAIGTKPDGSDFNIGIQRPFEDRGEPITTVQIHDLSVVSSGIYERYYIYEGKNCHHILDPATGHPTDNGLLAVSIITESSAKADALSTICMVLGPEKGKDLIASLPDTEAVFISDDYEVSRITD